MDEKEKLKVIIETNDGSITLESIEEVKKLAEKLNEIIKKEEPVYSGYWEVEWTIPNPRVDWTYFPNRWTTGNLSGTVSGITYTTVSS